MNSQVNVASRLGVRVGRPAPGEVVVEVRQILDLGIWLRDRGLFGPGPMILALHRYQYS